MSNEKIYLGKTETKETKYGKMHRISFGPQDFEKMAKLKNSKGWLNCNIKESQEGGMYIQVDTWKPKEKAVSAPTSDDDMPF